MTNNYNQDDVRDDVKLTNPELLYQITDKSGQIIDYDKANGRQLFNHYRHSMTNYDQVLKDIREEQGHVSNRQAKQATAGAAEQVLELYRDEHTKVIQDSQKKGQILKDLFRKAGVGTATALSNFLDSCSESVKKIARLESSQQSLRIWNDTYRVQGLLVRSLLTEAGVSEEICKKVDTIYKARSANKAIEVGQSLLQWEKSEILKLLKKAKAIKYGNYPED